MSVKEVLLAFLLAFALTASPAKATNITISSNGYSNIVVAISPDVPDTWADTILQNIQFMIRRASSVLYRATKYRAYIKDVRILVPESWSNIRANVSTWETYSVADVRVAPASSTHGDVPYTVQSGGCGQPGEYIHFTPDYLRTIGQSNNTSTFGPPEKVFVHQWAHLRYGVFDEFGTQGDKRYPLFYKDSLGNSIPNLCTDLPPIFTTKDVNTQGPCSIDPTTGVYNDNCVYDLLPDFVPDSSLMSVHTLDSTVDFCVDDQSLAHVYVAPTKHNALCGTKSVWSVISKHPDFANNNNPPVDLPYLEPTFRILRSVNSRFVLVADTSGSMNDFNRIVRLYESCHRWIKYDIANGSYLGMVQFASGARILSPLVQITDDASRYQLISKLPHSAVGGTCIGCGLQAALDVLRPAGPGGIIILLTDGEETDRPFINTVLPSVIAAGVRVVSIAFGRKAEDKIEDLATKTNGKSYFIDDSDTSQGLNDAFIGSLTYQPAVPADQIVVLLFQRQYQNVTGDGRVTGNFGVDYTVGRNFVFRIDYTQRNYIRYFSLRSPSNVEYTQLEYDDVAKVAMFKLADAEVGMWYFTITVTTSTVDAIAVRVTSQTRSVTTAPITTECYVPDGNTISDANSNPVRILAKVMQGMNPVIGVKVRARIEVPSGPAEYLELYDNGASADTTSNDGIYSRYYVAVTTAGRYTVECEISNTDTSYISGKSISRSKTDFLISTKNPSRLQGTKNLVTFTRVADGGSFKVTQPVSAVTDPYPPSRVTDLYVDEVGSSPNRSITIQFTAPGEDLDSGTAASYEIRYSPDYNDLREQNFGSGENSTLVMPEHVHVNSSLKPLPAGSLQMITFFLKVNQPEIKTYFVALRAVDRSGQKAAASNVATALFPEIHQQATGLSTKVIVAIVIGSILGALLIAGVAYLIARKKYLTYHEADTQAKP